MKTLIISDLSRNEHLDRPTLAAVRGGWKMGSPSYHLGDLTYAPSHDASITAVQNLGQQQSVLTATANDAAFIGHGVSVNSNVSQDGKNKIVG